MLVPVSTYKEAKKLLKLKGSKVVANLGHDGNTPVFIEKADFIKEVINSKRKGVLGPRDYKGNAVEWLWDGCESHLYVKCTEL